MEECSVCGEMTAEYKCCRCDEFVCEDCTVAMTYTNQIDETRCHNCSPDEPTMVSLNKKSKPKTMERLNTISVGLPIKREVLNSWIARGDNFCAYEIEGTYTKRAHPYYTSSSDNGYVKVIKIGREGFATALHIEDQKPDVWCRLEGFVDFYNQFYKLDTPKSKVEDWNNCIFYTGTKEKSKTIIDILNKIGFAKFVPMSYGYVRTHKSGKGLSSGNNKENWESVKVINPREFGYEEAIAALTGNQTPMTMGINFANTKVICKNNKETTAVHDRLRDLGYLWGGSLPTNSNVRDQSREIIIYIYGDMSLGWNHNTPSSRDEYNHLKTITVADILGKSLSKARPKLDLKSLSGVWWKVPNKEVQDKLLYKLFELGYRLNDKAELWPNHLTTWAITDNGEISGGRGYSSYELLDYELIINTNNTPLNTKTDGKKVIVCRPHPRITAGQRPEGSSISGKTGRARVSSGHLSYRTISS